MKVRTFNKRKALPDNVRQLPTQLEPYSEDACLGLCLTIIREAIRHEGKSWLHTPDGQYWVTLSGFHTSRFEMM